jgi:phosphoenolpyruvate carboxylase
VCLCRDIVFRNPAFLKYFRQATPESELGDLNIGSRPTRRKAADAGVGSLRAIPWIFAWTQTRHILPSWLGLGEALAKLIPVYGDDLKDMMEEWPLFSSTLSLIEMTLAKADMNIAEAYDATLVTDPEVRLQVPS